MEWNSYVLYLKVFPFCPSVRGMHRILFQQNKTALMLTAAGRSREAVSKLEIEIRVEQERLT